MTDRKPERLSPDDEGIARAAALLAEGGLVAVPTETVYGLAADARRGDAVAGIYRAKGRPAFNPLIVHVADTDTARRIARFDAGARRLAAAFWPGPMTLVLPLAEGSGLSPPVTAGLDTVAIRVPAHPVMRALLRAFDGPLAAPSANPSGRISATTAQHVIDGLGDAIDAVIDAGPCEVGLESTILAPSAKGVRILREGGIPRAKVAGVAGPILEGGTTAGRGRIEAPGQLERHYAPRVALVRRGKAVPGEIRIGFGPGPADLNLSPSGDLAEAARNLFRVLHEAEALALTRGAPAISVADIPETGLGRAINDRLARAAHPGEPED